MGKETKTNAMRMLDKNKISYEMYVYETDTFVDGITSTLRSGYPLEQSFKTLVTVSKSGAYYVFEIPVAEELDLKKAARAAKEKALEMLPVKELTKVTGYVRGGCSPIGMKKQFPVYIHESARTFSNIRISAGRIGSSIELAPADLAAVTGGMFCDVIKENNPKEEGE
jgi:Cys-tRNA(Pro)/Cys-tRNA(Cys) deacylase